VGDLSLISHDVAFGLLDVIIAHAICSKKKKKKKFFNYFGKAI
jgi:hypothetical protein